MVAPTSTKIDVAWLKVVQFVSIKVDVILHIYVPILSFSTNTRIFYNLILCFLLHDNVS